MFLFDFTKKAAARYGRLLFTALANEPGEAGQPV